MKSRLSHQTGWVEKRTRNGKTVYMGRWYVRDAEAPRGWRKKSKRLHCSSLKQAKIQHAKEMGMVNEKNLRHCLVANANITFESFSKGLWQNYLDLIGAKKSTRSSYGCMLRLHLLPTLGSFKLEDISKVDISALFGKLVAKGLSLRYQLNVYTLLKRMFEIALEHDLIGSSPVCPKLHRPKYRRKSKPVLSAAEIGAVLREIPPYWRPLFYTGMNLALRAGELLALRWCIFDEASSTIRVDKTLYKGELQDHAKTEASEATMPVTSQLKGILLQHKSQSAFTQPKDYMFCKPDGGPPCPDFLRKSVLYPAMDRAGIKRTKGEYGFHILRHSAATIMWTEKGLKQAQILLRHSDMATTADIYVHPSEEETRVNMEAMEDKIFEFYPPVAHQKHLGSETVQ